VQVREVWADVERTMRCKVAMLTHVSLSNRLITERYVTFVHVAGGISLFYSKNYFSAICNHGGVEAS
jgi:hypothetical protein